MERFGSSHMVVKGYWNIDWASSLNNIRSSLPMCVCFLVVNMCLVVEYKL